MSQNGTKPSETSRRDFLKTTAVAGTTFAVSGALLGNVHAAGDDVIKVGLIGCGGRGTGAANDCLHSSPNVKVMAMGDAFADRLEGSLNDLRNNHGEKIDVPAERRFVGLDAYQKVLASDINYVILATPPGFRPIHIEAAVAAGKNFFTEKPVGTDGPGIRRVLAAYEEAKKKNLCVAAGTQRRHQAGYIETMQRVHDGAIGNIVSGRCFWNQGALWHRDREESWNDLEYEIRNWLYYTWLSGDHIVEQHVHNLDVINWAVGSHPLSANGMGGRQLRVGPKFGNIFDHFAIDYEYPHGVHVLSMARQIEGCDGSVSEALAGSKGFCQVDRYTITGENAWRRGRHSEDVNPYVQEHADLIDCIRNGKPINELQNVAYSTLTAIMGRMSAYTGKVVKWEQALNSKQDLFPQHLDWGTLPTPEVAIPGKTKLT